MREAHYSREAQTREAHILLTPPSPSKPPLEISYKIVGKNGDLWSLVETSGNYRKYHKSVQG